MATIDWKNAAGGDFDTGGNWVGGNVPGPGDDAVINAATKTGYTVTSSVNNTVHSIQTIALVTLSINGGTFATATGGINAGTIAVGNNTAFTAGGTLTNSGKLSLNSGGNVTSLIVTGAKLVLNGAGAVTLNDNSQNFISASTAGATFTNVNDKISGAGTIGLGGMVLVNQAKGVIESLGSNTLVLAATGGVNTNAGLLEGAGAGGLTISGMSIKNTGTILAASHVHLASATISGGFLKITGAGVIDTVDRGTLLDGTAGSVTNAGQFNIANNTSLNIQGVINDTGTLALVSAGNVTQLVVTTANATLTGAGAVTMTDSSQNFIIGTITGPRGGQSVSTLTNTGIIKGAGQVGGNLALVNSGVINATQQNTALILSTGNAAVAGSNLIVNSGTLESTNAGKLTSVGGLSLSNIVVANDPATGLILANGLHTHVDLASATVQGGTLQTLSGGVIQTVDRGSLLDGLASPVTIAGVVQMLNNTSLSIQGSIVNNGTLSMLSGGNVTQIVVTANNATITGGVVNLSDSSQNFIIGTITGARGAQALSTLTNQSVISGSGQIGADLLIDNVKTINATGGSALVIVAGSTAVAGGSVVINSGTLKSTNPGNLTSVGGLVLSGVSVSNSGVILASGLHTHVDLQGATILGGQLTTASGGVIETANGDRGSVLDGLSKTVTNAGTLVVTNDAALTLRGAIKNTATIMSSSVGNLTDLIIGDNSLTASKDNATLSGAGHVTLSDNSQNRIYGASANAILTNVDNTIVGAGQLGAGELRLVNQAAGVINAVGNNALIVNVGAVAVKNSGLMEGSGAGGLTIQNSTIDNSTGGKITANDGSVISLQNADIIGGTLAVLGTGAFQTTDVNSLFNGQTSTVINTGLVNINNNTALTLQGAFANSGTLSLESVGNFTDLIIDVTGATLSGKGVVNLSSSGTNRIYGATAATTLTNVDNTIQGGGQLGAGHLTLVNQAAGVIDANSATGLTINVGAPAVTNAGLIEATGTGGLLVQSSTIKNGKTGVILAGDGSVVALQSAIIVGGTLNAAGTGFFHTTDVNSLFNGQITAVTSKATVSIDNNTALTLQGSFVNTKAGVIALNSGGNFTDLIIDTTGATLSGGGSVTMTNNGNNRIYGATAASVLTNVDNNISGGGQIGAGQLTLINQSAGVIDGVLSTALVLDTGANIITNAGTIEADAGGTTIIDSAVANTGVIKVNGGLLQINAAVTGGGKAIIHGGTLDVTVANAAESVTFVGGIGTLQLEHSQSYKGSVTGFTTTTGTAFDLRDIGFNGSTIATYSGNASGGTLTVTNGTQTAKITMVGNYLSSTFTVGNDGSGGTIVQDPPEAPAGHAPVAAAAASPHGFTTAMAMVGSHAAATAIHAAPPAHFAEAMLVAPRLGYA